MNEIDWGKAPEGADKYDTYNNLFYKGAQPGLQVFTRGKWKQAVIMKSNELFVYRPSTPSWSGEGLPPAGVVCEAAIPHTSGPNNERSFIWIEGSVIAYYEIKGKTYAWFAGGDGFYPPSILEFRPVRTPEQIAADEREAAIDAMLAATPAPGSDISLRVCEQLYDAGYRKP